MELSDIDHDLFYCEKSQIKLDILNDSTVIRFKFTDETSVYVYNSIFSK